MDNSRRKYTRKKQSSNKDTGRRVSQLTTELGTTGLKTSSGQITEEFLTQLDGEKGLRVYREMAENDPTVSAVLFAIEMLIRSVHWSAEPVTQEKEDVERAEFLESCLQDMELPFTEVISEILTMLPYGFSIHEIVYKLRMGRTTKSQSNYDDAKIGWKKLPIRAQDTIDLWNLTDKGELESITQVAPPNYNSTIIPSEKFLLFRTAARYGNPQGRSILRSAYRPWYFKKKIEEFEAIGVERDLAGLPTAYVPPELLYENAGAKEKAMLAEIKKIVRNVRMDSQMGIVFPQAFDDSGNRLYEFKLLSAPGGKQFSTNEIIVRYDQRIAMTVLADFILMGQSNVGSFALSSSKTMMFSTALGAWLDSIASMFNREAIPKLFAVNGWTGPVPKLMHGDIETPDLGELGGYVTALANAGASLFPDDKLERHLRRMARLPEPEVK